MYQIKLTTIYPNQNTKTKNQIIELFNMQTL